MYEYALSEVDMIKLLLYEYETIQTMTEKEFIDWFKNKLLEIVDDAEYIDKFDVSKA